MFIELVDALRCPHPHDASWLVLGAERMDGRNVMEGVLGCPVCRARFPIAGGVADLRTAPAPGAPDTTSTRGAPDMEQAMRVAAFLNLADAHGYAVLVGDWTRHAPAVRELADVHLLLVNAPAGTIVEPGTSGLRVDTRLPLADGSARGVALDAAAASLVADAVRAVPAKGRIVAPVSVDVPAGVTELARDAAVWVAERDAAASGLISLSRADR